MTGALSGQQWTIAAQGNWAVVVEVGGGLREYGVGDVSVLDGYGTDEICPAGAGQVLAPWPNRVRDGRWSWEGQDLQLDLSEPATGNAIHGLVRWRPWQLAERTPDAVTVTCQIMPTPGYPFSLDLATRWSVSQAGLRAEHTATNTGGRPAPFGLGIHPYFLVPGRAVSELVLTVPARFGVDTDERGLPTGERDAKFGSGRALGDAMVDTPYGGLRHDDDGLARLSLVDPQGAGVEVWMDRAFGWAQVFTADPLAPPRRRRSVAIEPMTCPPDAFNSGTDLVVIDPTDAWRGTWGARVLAADDA